jgi:hypothetical protein
VIRANLNAAGEAQLVLRLGNGWTAALIPHPDGTATLAAWASHDEEPRPGRMNVLGGGPARADEAVEFLVTIAAAAAVAAPETGVKTQ